MKQLRFLSVFAGILWIAVGVSALLLSLVALIIRVELYNFIRANLPVLVTAFEPLVSKNLVVQEIAGIALGIFCIGFGRGLSNLRSWARPIAVAFHIGMAIFILAITLVVFTILRDGGFSPTLSTVILGLGSALAFGLGFFGYRLSSQDAIDVFTPITIPPPAKSAPAICPTCASKLDMDSNSCRKCDAPLDDIPPRNAKLVEQIDEKTKQEYTITLGKDRDNKIGRDHEGNTIKLSHKSVSGRHATIEYVKGGGLHLHALDDTYGTYVNDLLVRDVKINDGDKIRLGEAEFTLVVDSASKNNAEKNT